MVDNFEVEKLYEDRPYERHQFSFSKDGKDYKGDFHEDEIHWFHPHPQQDLTSSELVSIENKVRQLLSDHNVIEDIEDVEIEPMLVNHSREVHRFGLTIEGEEYKGMFQYGDLEWFHPKPERRVKSNKVERAERKVHEKIRRHLNE